MELAHFLERVLPDDGHIVVANRSGDRFRHEVFTDLEKVCKRILFLADRHDVWFCVSTMKDKEFIDDKGRKRSPRNQANTYKVRCLYADVDIGEDKGYRTVEDAIAGLKAFLKATQLPPPTFVVHSGYGLHLYWVLDRQLSPQEWQPLADSFKRAAAKHGFNIDPAVTSDCARVLRPIGTVNYKHGTSRPVRMLTDTGLTLSVDTARKKLSRYLFTMVEGGASKNEDLKLKFTGQRGPVLAQKIFELCPYLEEVKRTEGADSPEPEWMAVLHLLSFCDDGREHIHDVSRGYFTYVPEKTEKKFQERFGVNRESYGPTTCSKFDEHQKARGTSFCDTCPHKGRIKSPIRLGFESDPEMPKGFRWVEKQLQCFVPATDDTPEHWEPILAEYRFWDFEIEEIRTPGQSFGVEAASSAIRKLRFKFTDPGKAVQSGEIDLSTVVTLQTFCEEVSRNGIWDQKPALQRFHRFMTGFLSTLKRQNKIRSVTTQGGWQDYEGKRGFGIGEDIITADETFPNVLRVDPAIASHYQPKGKLEEWQKVAQALIDQPNMAATASLCAAFAAPLIEFSAGRGGYIWSLFSDETGSGKSTILRTCLAAFADPAHATQSVNDTENAIADALAKVSNTPLIWDEVRTNQNESYFVKFIFNVHEGREKRRMTQKLQVIGGRTWQTVLLCGTNVSIGDIMKRSSTGTAGLARAYELEVDKPLPYLMLDDRRVEGFQLKQFLDKVSTNYGHAGRLYIEYLVSHYDEAKDLVQRTLDRWHQVLDGDETERFQMELTGLALAAALLLRQAGILNVDAKRLADFFKIDLNSRRADRKEEVKAIDLESYIVSYLASEEHNTLVTNKLPKGPGKFSQNIAVVMHPKTGRITIQRATMQDDIVIRRPMFYEWLAKKRANRTSLMKRLRSRPYYRGEPKKALGAGTEYKSVQTQCIVLSGQGLDKYMRRN